MATLVVVNKTKDFEADIPGVQIVTAKEYLTNKEYSGMRGSRVFNLCRSYSYQSTGYYISLLATARGHKVMPNIATIQDTKTQAIVKLKSEELTEIIQSTLSAIKKPEYEMDICFGKAIKPEFDALAQQIFYQFEAPFLRAFFSKKGDTWKLDDVDPISTKNLPDEAREFAIESAAEFFNTKRTQNRKQPFYRYEMAVLVNAAEVQPPSDEKAIKKFIKAARELGIGVWTITKDEFNRIGEYDALFIRETTNVNHYTYRFARRAAIEGLVVIDDPESILRCSNKVYLAELLERNNIPKPKTLVIHKDNVDEIPSQFSFPVILKMPDSCFSQGVIKVKTQEELEEKAKEMFAKSELCIAQEFLPTDFDWRIGILDGKPLFACKYYMAGKHWQIMDWDKKGSSRFGKHETLAIEDVPDSILKTALKAANLIGNGFYGVDIKEVDGKPYVIEVNDNPSVDSGVEDQVLKDELYMQIMKVFLERMERITAGQELNQ
jgi:glutathione synthase/RimK-type ligase-like ATP-grasp enzyme